MWLRKPTGGLPDYNLKLAVFTVKDLKELKKEAWKETSKHCLNTWKVRINRHKV